jgi:hypothetical protein
MKAGRELDALVAEKVMGWERRMMTDQVTGPEEVWAATNPIDGQKFAVALVCSFQPSQLIAAAWQVWDKLAELTDRGWTLLRESRNFTNRAEMWSIHDSPFNLGDFPSYAEADTAPLAICLAALKAVADHTMPAQPTATPQSQ